MPRYFLCSCQPRFLGISRGEIFVQNFLGCYELVLFVGDFHPGIGMHDCRNWDAAAHRRIGARLSVWVGRGSRTALALFFSGGGPNNHAVFSCAALAEPVVWCGLIQGFTLDLASAIWPTVAHHTHCDTLDRGSAAFRPFLL
jgi:hypothetical protein